MNPFDRSAKKTPLEESMPWQGNREATDVPADPVPLVAHQPAQSSDKPKCGCDACQDGADKSCDAACFTNAGAVTSFTLPKTPLPGHKWEIIDLTDPPPCDCLPTTCTVSFADAVDAGCQFPQSLTKVSFGAAPPGEWVVPPVVEMTESGLVKYTFECTAEVSQDGSVKLFPKSEKPAAIGSLGKVKKPWQRRVVEKSP